MKPFRRVEGVVAPLDRSDVDTDQIIPKQFLKRIQRTGFGAFLFHDWRTLPDGSPNSGFVLNQEPYRGSPVLVAGDNFGCGSSREHAAWAIADYGFRVIIAPGFADIFHGNCFQNGLLPVELDLDQVRHLLDAALERPGYRVAVDLEDCSVCGEDGFRAVFDVDPFRRSCLLEGMDDVALTLRHESAIAAYEKDKTPGCNVS